MTEPLSIAIALENLKIGDIYYFANGTYEVTRIPEGYLYARYETKTEQIGGDHYTQVSKCIGVTFIPKKDPL